MRTKRNCKNCETAGSGVPKDIECVFVCVLRNGQRRCVASAVMKRIAVREEVKYKCCFITSGDGGIDVRDEGGVRK